MSAPKLDSDGVVDRPTGSVDGPPSRYDFVLAVIPLVFVLAAVVGELDVLGLHDAMLGAGLIAAAAVADVLFVNPPRNPT